MNVLWLIAWLVILVVTVIVEVSTAALVSIWFSIGAGLAAIICFIGGPVWLQVVVFVIASAVLCYCFQKWWKKSVKTRKTATNTDRNIGKEFLVTEEISNLAGTGAVKMNGQLWTAKALDNDTVIPAGSRIVVERIEGSKVYVKKAEMPENK